MLNNLKSVCVFCGARAGGRPEFREAARTTGEALARNRVSVIFGAGNVGMMSQLADACLDAGGHAVGVIPKEMVERELLHDRIQESHVVHSMFERKELMMELADAFIGLPGGFGTLDELLEALTWAQLGLHEKPIGILNVLGCYDRLIELFDEMVANGFVAPEHRMLVTLDTDIDRLLRRLDEAAAN